MIFRIFNIVVIGALVLAAAYVYRIKFDSTVQAEHLAKLRIEVRRERDRIAALRAEWGELDNPARIEILAKRFLQLKPIAPTQFDSLDRLPERPPDDARAANDDPIGGMIGNLDPPETGTIPAPVAPAATPPDQPSGAPSPPSGAPNPPSGAPNQ
ncbi:MAG TPA: hypothetical protein VK337_03640 [Xanthobacteraceae bacterium]|nr:hypothetical protein [Xanthobacteraceae bacterium]